MEKIEETVKAAKAEYKRLTKRGAKHMTIGDIKTAISIYDMLTGKVISYGEFVTQIPQLGKKS